ALWRRMPVLNNQSNMVPFEPVEPQEIKAKEKHITKQPEAIVFIKGNNKVRSNFNGQAGVDPWRQTYVVTNSGPAMRIGRNLHILRPAKPDGKVTPLTTFTEGFVADCEVSWDGKKVIFARRINDEERNYEEVPYKKAELQKAELTQLGCKDDPWWHIWEINVDGTGLKQLTFGPYHDVAPAYLPDGRIVFSSSRIGLRDEYHGYPCVGITIMNPDGSDIHPIGFNLGGDRDPAVLHDGRIIFSRLDNFYSRLKTEVTVQVIFPDGTKNLAFYGPERRPFWRDVHIKNAAWTLRESFQENLDNRNRVLRVAQPQPLDKDRIICASSGGLVICGPGPYKEQLVGHDRKYAVTSPYPIDEKTILCAATPKVFNIDGQIITCGTPEFEELEKGPELFLAATNIDLALYTMNVETGEMTLLYNDPDMADFEARPIMSRPKPASLAENPLTRQDSYTAKFFCNSARISRTERIRNRGKLVRLIEGQPIVSRHETHQNRPINEWIGLDLRWKNHGGTIARILGTIPLAADGSFYVEVPADRLLHFQVLDSDRRVVGNQVFWMYARPNETRSCIGCHEQRDMTMLPNHFAAAAQIFPVKMLPTGEEFTYLAKAWMKGWIPDEVEERTRTVHAINLIGRR
ncbi:MAG: HzsA-related protein, partial [Planctomycetota bacterium]